MSETDLLVATVKARATGRVRVEAVGRVNLTAAEWELRGPITRLAGPDGIYAPGISSDHSLTTGTASAPLNARRPSDVFRLGGPTMRIWIYRRRWALVGAGLIVTLAGCKSGGGGGY